MRIAEPITPAGAVLDPSGTYRYQLHRRWMLGMGWAVFVMLNPSTADAIEDDPTIRRCIGFAKSWGRQGLIVVNLFAGRATKPEDLGKIVDPEGRANEAYVVQAAKLARSGTLVCAWGAHWMVERSGQDKRALEWIAATGASPLCLGTTKDGFPRHPLYVSRTVEPVPYRGRG